MPMGIMFFGGMTSRRELRMNAQRPVISGRCRVTVSVRSKCLESRSQPRDMKNVMFVVKAY
jgi:hypothetical protein